MSWELARLGLIHAIRRIDHARFDREPFECADDGSGITVPIAKTERERAFNVLHVEDTDDGLMGMHSVSSRRARVSVEVRYQGNQPGHDAEVRAVEDAPFIIRAVTDPDEFSQAIDGEASVIELVAEAGPVRRRAIRRGEGATDVIASIPFEVSYRRSLA